MSITIITPTPTPVLKMSPTISQLERNNRREISEKCMIVLFSILFGKELITLRYLLFFNVYKYDRCSHSC